MDQPTINILLGTIQRIVAAPGPWKEKLDAIRKAAGESKDTEAAFEEFASWFVENYE